MRTEYRVVWKGGEGEIIEKKSRFIATVRPVANEAEAVMFIEEMKKKYWNASHNCSAFVTGLNENVRRCSDDGEPGGTAGKPMLEVLLGEGLHNTAVVVTRYFGGTLLGTGGLVKAYTKAVQEGLHCSTVITKCPGIKIKIKTDYHGSGKIQYILGQRQIPVLDADYTDTVIFSVVVSQEKYGELIKALTEATSGQAEIESDGEVYYSEVNREILLFDD